MEKYTKLFKQNIDNICKHFGVRHEDILFARDCPRQEIWRRDFYPTYKGTRSNGEIDSATLVQVQDKIKEGSMDSSWTSGGGGTNGAIASNMLGMGPVIKHNNETFLGNGYVRLLRIDSAEADDIIATIAMRVRQLQPGRKIIIVANDQDYMQLHDDNLQIVELSSKFKNIRKGDLTGEQYLLQKIIGGDASDNIPGCGVRGGKSLALDPERLAKTLAENKAFEEQFLLNQRLVDFRKMPSELQDRIWDEFLKIAPEFRLSESLTPIRLKEPRPIAVPSATVPVPTLLTPVKIVPKITLKPPLFPKSK